jgi:hypothetical protein
MRFMIIRKADEQTEAGVLPNTEQLASMGQYVEGLAKAGVLLAGDGLMASSRGARVKFSGGKPRVIDGPFAETKELIAGYLLIDVKSRDEAIEWVRRWPAWDSGGEVELEVRQVLGADDLGDDFTPELREQQARTRAEAASQQ